MATEEVKAINMLVKTLGEGIRALNSNLVDCCKSLRRIADALDYQKDQLKEERRTFSDQKEE